MTDKKPFTQLLDMMAQAFVESQTPQYTAKAAVGSFISLLMYIRDAQKAGYETPPSALATIRELAKMYPEGPTIMRKMLEGSIDYTGL